MCSDLCSIINNKFNFIRLIVYKLLIHYKNIYKYYVEYKKFISYFKFHYPQFVFIHLNKINFFIIKNTDKVENIIKKYNLSKDTVLITQDKYYKYYAIKLVLNRLFEYESVIQRYLSNTENAIKSMIDGLNDFRQLYIQFIKIISNDENNFDFQHDIDIILNNFQDKKYNINPSEFKTKTDNHLEKLLKNSYKI